MTREEAEKTLRDIVEWMLDNVNCGQSCFDSPPEPTSQFDYALLQSAGEMKLALDTLTAPEPGGNVLPGGWRDIASAPKDGTPILAFFLDTCLPVSFVGRRFVSGLMPKASIYPTHWMPLPAPPIAKIGEPK